MRYLTLQLVPNQSNTSGLCDDDHLLKLSEVCCLLWLWYFLMTSFLPQQFTLFATCPVSVLF